MSSEVAGGFSAGAQTADIGLKEIEVGEGDTVVIHGAAGAVGTIAVQLSGLWGATVIGAAREPQHDYLRSLGAIPIRRKASPRSALPQRTAARPQQERGARLGVLLPLPEERPAAPGVALGDPAAGRVIVRSPRVNPALT
jgi:hypothetical protein